MADFRRQCVNVCMNGSMIGNIVTLISSLPPSPGPCPPSGVTSSLQCEGNVGTVSWQPAVLADSYQAWATGNGHSHMCNATGLATQCSFTDIHCGEVNGITVVTVDRGCHSEPSAPVLQTSGNIPV